MVTRTVARYAGAQAQASATHSDRELPSGASNQCPPEETLRHAHATSIAGVIDQIAQVAAHALDIFGELRAESEQLHQRFHALADRVEVVAAMVLDGDRSAYSKLPTAHESDRVLRVPELSHDSAPRAMSRAMQTLYDQCEPVPPFELLTEFCITDDDATSISTYRKRYTNPEFFKEDWMQKETFRQQHAQQQKEDRRQHRKEQRRSVAANTVDNNAPGQDTAVVAATSPTAAPVRVETEETESTRLSIQQKMNFLNIRSWKERYGTGEGKEFLKPPTPRDMSQLPAVLALTVTTSPLGGCGGSGDKKKRQLSSAARKSGTGAVCKEGEAMEDEAPPGPPSVRGSESHQGGFASSSPSSSEPTSVAVAAAVAVGGDNKPRGSFGGAFMEEIDDPGDDLELDPCSILPPPTASTTRGTTVLVCSDDPQTAFLDQGLSYFDPHAMDGSAQPPPPPPPLVLTHGQGNYQDEGEEEEDSWATGAPPPPPHLPPSQRGSFVAEYDDMDGFIPPPPPLSSRRSYVAMESHDMGSPSRRSSFVPPPPPPAAAHLQTQPAHVLVRMPSLLQALQSKRSELRHVDPSTATDEEEKTTGILSPRLNLLDQIRMKQQLKPVDLPPTRQAHRAPQSPPSHTNAIASSIARILERRNMTAYDSDDASDSSDDADW